MQMQPKAVPFVNMGRHQIVYSCTRIHGSRSVFMGGHAVYTVFATSLGSSRSRGSIMEPIWSLYMNLLKWDPFPLCATSPGSQRPHHSGKCISYGVFVGDGNLWQMYPQLLLSHASSYCTRPRSGWFAFLDHAKVLANTTEADVMTSNAISKHWKNWTSIKVWGVLTSRICY